MSREVETSATCRHLTDSQVEEMNSLAILLNPNLINIGIHRDRNKSNTSVPYEPSYRSKKYANSNSNLDQDLATLQNVKKNVYFALSSNPALKRNNHDVHRATLSNEDLTRLPRKQHYIEGESSQPFYAKTTLASGSQHLEKLQELQIPVADDQDLIYMTLRQLRVVHEKITTLLDHDAGKLEKCEPQLPASKKSSPEKIPIITISTK